MASLIPNQETPGRVLRRVEFDPVGRGRRFRIRLGKVNLREGNDFKRCIEEVIHDLRLGQTHSRTLCEWLNKLSPIMQQRLEKAGLMKTARRSDHTLGDLLDSVSRQASVKASTQATYNNTIRNLIAYFGRNRALSSIGQAEAHAFKEFLQSPTTAYGVRPLSRATVGRRIIMARQFFKVAVSKEMLTKNPFESVKGGHQRNKERMVFVEAAWVDRMVASTENQDWKLLLLLGRYGGLRLPSEVVRLQWKHIDFIHNSILIHSVKTEHHEGKEVRHVPLFDELREVLLVAFAEGVRPDDFLIQNPNYRRPESNLRTQFVRIAKAAGVKPWAKAFQNMRATRETELIERNEIKEACQIIGNSEIVALQHYQMLRPKYVANVIERDRLAKKEAQKEAQTLTELLKFARKATEGLTGETIVSSGTVGSYPPDSAEGCGTPMESMGDGGLEPSTSGV